MTTMTLRRRCDAVVVSLPRKILAPLVPRPTLAQLLEEQAALDRRIGRRTTDQVWLESAPRGRESL